MRTFTGGISLSPPLKMLKEKLMIEQDEILTFSPTMVFIPLAQHIGAPVEPIVSVGDYVKQGEVIAETDAFVSAKIHASVSGKIVDMVDWPNQNNEEGKPSSLKTIMLTKMIFCLSPSTGNLLLTKPSSTKSVKAASPAKAVQRFPPMSNSVLMKQKKSIL